MSSSIVRGDVADQSWALSLPGGFHQNIVPAVYDANFLLPRDNFLIPRVETKNTSGACYERGYIDLRPGRKETIRQYITNPSSYVQDLHPFGLGGGTGGVDNLNLLDNSAYPTPYAHMEGAEESALLAKRESKIEQLDPLSNGYAVKVFGIQGEQIIKRHERSKEIIKQRDAMLAARRELTLREGQAMNPIGADIGAANRVAADAAANIDVAANQEIQKRALEAAMLPKNERDELYIATLSYNAAAKVVNALQDEYDEAFAKGDAKTLFLTAQKMKEAQADLARKGAEVHALTPHPPDDENVDYLNSEPGTLMQDHAESNVGAVNHNASPESGNSTAGQGAMTDMDYAEYVYEQQNALERAENLKLYSSPEIMRNLQRESARTATPHLQTGLRDYGLMNTPTTGGALSAGRFSNINSTNPYGADLNGLVTNFNASQSDLRDMAVNAQYSVYLNRRIAANGLDQNTYEQTSTNNHSIDQLRANLFSGMSVRTPEEAASQGQTGAYQTATLQAVNAFDPANSSPAALNLNTRGTNLPNGLGQNTTTHIRGQGSPFHTRSGARYGAWK